ncbi:MAG: DNA mismatch repair protein MutS, partial [Pseudolabrys sp.]|nr:DNA mismatch repair protein MutS [Pseudolabrys sp.]
EALHDMNRCRALFATHYHELTALAAKLPNLACHTVRVKEWQGEVVFLHEVVPGAADRSYGVQVAKLAGLPAAVIERARAVLAKLEAEDRATPKGFEDLPLFSAAPPSAKHEETALDQLLAALAALNPDEMSPREAMDALYALKAKLAEKK